MHRVPYSLAMDLEKLFDDCCDVCLVEHDEEIHSATLSLREWHRMEVTKYLYEETEPVAA